jgi:hypothetical protein
VHLAPTFARPTPRESTPSTGARDDAWASARLTVLGSGWPRSRGLASPAPPAGVLPAPGGGELDVPVNQLVATTVSSTTVSVTVPEAVPLRYLVRVLTGALGDTGDKKGHPCHVEDVNGDHSLEPVLPPWRTWRTLAMRLTRISRQGFLGAVLVGFLACLAVTPASALGPSAPPNVYFAAVWVENFTSNAFPVCLECTNRLFANVGALVPGGSVPLNIASVTVQIPTGQTFAVPLDRVDWAAEESFFVDLNELGVVAAPPGSYTFTVTDTAGGVTVRMDDLGVPQGLPVPTNIAVSGSQGVPSADGDAGVFVRYLNLATTPTPTITWTPAAGALRQAVRVREINRDRDNFSRTFVDSTTSSVTLPAGVFVNGRRYQITIEAFEHPNGLGCSISGCTGSDANERSRARIELITEGPTLFLGGTSGTVAAGQNLNITATIYNTGPPTSVHALGWIGLPTGGIVNVLNMQNLVIPQSVSSNFVTNLSLFSRVFDGTEPSGVYVVGLRLTDPATGATVAFASRTFAK